MKPIHVLVIKEKSHNNGKYGLKTWLEAEHILSEKNDEHDYAYDKLVKHRVTRPCNPNQIEFIHKKVTRFAPSNIYSLEQREDLIAAMKLRVTDEFNLNMLVVIDLVKNEQTNTTLITID